MKGPARSCPRQPADDGSAGGSAVLAREGGDFRFRLRPPQVERLEDFHGEGHGRGARRGDHLAVADRLRLVAVEGIALVAGILLVRGEPVSRSEEHTSELQSLMRISYAVFCL